MLTLGLLLLLGQAADSSDAAVVAGAFGLHTATAGTRVGEVGLATSGARGTISLRPADGLVPATTLLCHAAIAGALIS